MKFNKKATLQNKKMPKAPNVEKSLCALGVGFVSGVIGGSFRAEMMNNSFSKSYLYDPNWQCAGQTIVPVNANYVVDASQNVMFDTLYGLGGGLFASAVIVTCVGIRYFAYHNAIKKLEKQNQEEMTK